MTAADALVRGWAAFDAQAWWAAYEEMTAAVNTAPLAAEDLVRLGTAAELTGAGPDMTPGGLPAPGKGMAQCGFQVYCAVARP